jgi:hypothetical protein
MGVGTRKMVRKQLLGIWLEKELKDKVTTFSQERGLSDSEIGRLAIISFLWQAGAK